MMESIKCSGFEEIQYEEQQTVEGGFFGPVLFTIWGIEVTVGHCLAAGATIGIAAGAAAS